MPADPSLNHLIRPEQERRRDHQAEGLRGLEIDHQLELRRLFYRQIRWFPTSQDLVYKGCPLPRNSGKVRTVSKQCARHRALSDVGRARKSIREREIRHLPSK